MQQRSLLPVLVKNAIVPLIGLALLAACDRPPLSGPAKEQAAWKAAVIEQRAKKDLEFKESSTSPMAGAQRFTLEASAPVRVFLDNGSIRVEAGDASGARLLFTPDTDNWTWSAPSGPVPASRNDKPAHPGPVTSGMLFTLERFTLAAYPSARQLTLIEFDPDREMLRRFHHLLYYAPDPAFDVTAKLERIPDPQPVTMLTSRNLRKQFYRYARLSFSVDGTACTLTAYKMNLTGPESDMLFVPFTDRTSGDTTYGAGRFLDIREPKGDTVMVDFNEAYNPLCNYSPAYNCPVPPAENALPVAIRAGEKTYPH